MSDCKEAVEADAGGNQSNITTVDGWWMGTRNEVMVKGENGDGGRKKKWKGMKMRTVQVNGCFGLERQKLTRKDNKRMPKENGKKDFRKLKFKRKKNTIF